MIQSQEQRDGSDGRMAIPKRSLILVSGIPATGKSSFARYLAREHGFAHYDLECYPCGWPQPELKPLWDSSRGDFLVKLQVLHPRVALDWGFPVGCLPWVRELVAAGTKLIWFTGSICRARAIFIERGGIDVCQFDAQVKAIQDADFPARLQCQSIDMLSEAGIWKKHSDVIEEVFRQ
jgi:hypothetical protein